MGQWPSQRSDCVPVDKKIRGLVQVLQIFVVFIPVYNSVTEVLFSIFFFFCKQKIWSSSAAFAEITEKLFKVPLLLLLFVDEQLNQNCLNPNEAERSSFKRKLWRVGSFWQMTPKHV